ncbi:hypothetical protein DESUT3_26880 [Desulfuromonas versatilis]|uniref:DUF1579 domain-containing protein n=1 Tax=Desulfuromonas versatilis TaxID=2802975 RepID=A0ABN6E1B6_9BACT|nr:DUF1579 domain-containing protein [Desulfuromonas versatilis]BCR05619.1 hypothetical protein DESUT3_26880 [Desulfuromonas versatilis]
MENKQGTERAGMPEGSGLMAQPQKQHRWLAKFLGEWDYQVSAMMGPDKPPETFYGTERVRPLGDFWVLAEGEGEMGCGGTATTLMTLGYSLATRRFVGTWIGSMMPHLWVYDGELDAAEGVLTLNAQGPDMEGRMSSFRDVIEFRSDDQRVLTSYMLGADDNWQEIMSATYRRKK